MLKDYEKLFSHLEKKEPPKGLFDRIILAIKREQELQHTRRLLSGFLSLFVISLISLPFSWSMLIKEIDTSGISYFISSAFSDINTFVILWRDFSLAIFESLPLAGMIAFAVSLGMAVFTVRLFLYKKRLLLGYLKQSFA